jgi:hypothetical protein
MTRPSRLAPGDSDKLSVYREYGYITQPRANISQRLWPIYPEALRRRWGRLDWWSISLIPVYIVCCHTRVLALNLDFV